MAGKQDWKIYWRSQERKAIVEEHAKLNIGESPFAGGYCETYHVDDQDEDPYTGRTREWEEWN